MFHGEYTYLNLVFLPFFFLFFCVIFVMQRIVFYSSNLFLLSVFYSDYIIFIYSFIIAPSCFKLSSFFLSLVFIHQFINILLSDEFQTFEENVFCVSKCEMSARLLFHSCASAQGHSSFRMYFHWIESFMCICTPAYQLTLFTISLIDIKFF